MPPEVFTERMEEPGQSPRPRTRASTWRRQRSCWPKPAGSPRGGVLTNAAGRAARRRVPAGAARLRAHRAALHRGAGEARASRPACASSTRRSISAAHDTFDFDIIVDRFPQSLSPGNEQRDFWGSDAADKDGSRNVIGIKNPAIDKLIDKIILAKDREELVAATRALDRVLLWNHYVVPQWHTPFERIAHVGHVRAPGQAAVAHDRRSCACGGMTMRPPSALADGAGVDAGSREAQ